MGILRKNDTERYPIVYRIQTGWARIGCRPCRQKRGAEKLPRRADSVYTSSESVTRGRVR